MGQKGLNKCLKQLEKEKGAQRTHFKGIWVSPSDSESSLRPQAPISSTACQGHRIKHAELPSVNSHGVPAQFPRGGGGVCLTRRCLRCWSSTAWSQQHAEAARAMPRLRFWLRFGVTRPWTLELLVSELGQNALNNHLYFYSHHSSRLLEGPGKGILKPWDQYQANCQVRSCDSQESTFHVPFPLSVVLPPRPHPHPVSFAALPQPASQAQSWKRVWEKSIAS